MALPTKPYKGARDFYPESKRLQKYMFNVWRETAEKYGFEEYDAPILEPLDIYLAKTGEEIVKEQTYLFEDRGGRKVVLRPEMTPTVSRMVAAKRQELGYPLRWYSIPNLWRYERPQRGRLREHWQLNVDIFGVDGISAEVEMISLIDDIFRCFGATSKMYEIRVNDRRLVNYVLQEYLGLNDQEKHDVSKLIDRMAKMDKSDFLAKLDEILTSTSKKSGVAEKLLAVLDANDLKDLPSEIISSGQTDDLASLMARLKADALEGVVYDPKIMRGFDYYTGIVFEVFDLNPDNNRSMLGGGRYDGLVGLFGVKAVPTVGFGWGDVTLENFLVSNHLLPNIHSETQVYLATVGEVDPFELSRELRKANITVAVDDGKRKLGDKIKTAVKKQIPYLLVVGEEELTAKKYELKNLSTAKSDKLTIKEIVERLNKK